MIRSEESLIIKDDYIYFNRDYEFDYTSWRTLCLQYRACGYKPKTIIRLIQGRYPEILGISDRMIYNRIAAYERKVDHNFRPIADEKEWNDHYKRKSLQQMGKTFNSSKTYTENQPIQGGDYRKFQGITKDEQRLLRSIRS